MTYIPEPEASQINGLPPNILPNARRRGEAPRHVVFGSRAFYKQADVEEWIKSRTYDPFAAAAKVANGTEVEVDHA